MSRGTGIGTGIAWLVADAEQPTGFHCYWYGGRSDDHLVEQAHVVGEADAVAWGHRRTPRIRIRTADARSAWAGSAPRPEGVRHTWVEPLSGRAGSPC